MRKPIIALEHQRSTRGQHAGLLLQRYLCRNATGENGKPEEKRALLQAAINAAANAEVQQLYQAAFQRWEKALPAGKQSVRLRTLGRLIVGLGTENVLETGIRLHHTYGMPILPGSALKGLAAHYCDQVWGERDNPNPSDETLKYRSARKEDRENNRLPEPAGKYHQLLFGTTDDSGCITFHDAWFVPEPRANPLKMDVMTPHHPRWLEGEVAPSDFDSPNPVPFLSVGGSFQVAVSWQGPDHPQKTNWTAQAAELLKQAVQEWGIGGKTSSGYGRLVDPNTVRAEPIKVEAKKAANLPKPGDKVEAVLLQEKTKNGGWKAKHEPSGLSGPVQNSGDVPSDKNPGDRLELIVAIAKPREIAFRYPTSTDEQRSKNPPKKGGQGKPPRRGGY